MPGVMTLGSDATGSTFDGALGYVRGKLADFNRLGTVELPALWRQANAVANAAANAGDGALAAKASGERSKIKTQQEAWERHNDTLASILAPLRAAGLGIVPVAAWVVVATIGVAAAMAAAFAFRDKARVAIAALCIEAVGKGQISADDCGKLAPPPPPSVVGSLVGLVALGGLAYFLFRGSRGQA